MKSNHKVVYTRRGTGRNNPPKRPSRRPPCRPIREQELLDLRDTLNDLRIGDVVQVETADKFWALAQVVPTGTLTIEGILHRPPARRTTIEAAHLAAFLAAAPVLDTSRGVEVESFLAEVKQRRIDLVPVRFIRSFKVRNREGDRNVA